MAGFLRNACLVRIPCRFCSFLRHCLQIRCDVSCTENCKEIISSYTLNFPCHAQDFERSALNGTCFDLFWLENPDYINHRIHYQTKFNNNQSALCQTMHTVCQPIIACSQDLGNPAGCWDTISDGVTQMFLFCVQQRK